jgi:glycosyltransferase involved in cell wall biosynthesis
LLVDPLDTEEISQALNQIVVDDSLRRVLVERGFQQVQLFSWQRCAQETLQVLEKAAHAVG